MTIEERRVIVIPIGLELDRALVGLSEYKPDMVYIIYSRKDGENVENEIDIESEKFKEIFVKKIRGLWKYEIHGVDVTNLSKCTKILKEIILKESEINQETLFFINISSSSKIFSFASFYLAGRYNEQVSLFYVKPTQYLMVNFVKTFQNIISSLKNKKPIDDLELYESEKLLNDYKKHGWTKEPFEIIEIPFYKISKYSNYEIKILSVMRENRQEYPDGFTIEDILVLMKKEPTEKKNKIKINYHLTELEKNGLIECSSINRKKISKLDNSGMTFLDTIADLILN